MLPRLPGVLHLHVNKPLVFCNKHIYLGFTCKESSLLALRATSDETHGDTYKEMYCWFSHDVTKIQTKKISILPRFYFHDALEQLKTNFHTNFCLKRSCGRVRLNF